MCSCSAPARRHVPCSRGWRENPVGQITVASRSSRHAHEAAEAVGADVWALDDVAGRLGEVDAVIGAMPADRWIVTADTVRLVQAAGGRTRVFVDLSMPRIIDPAVAEVPGVVVCSRSMIWETSRRGRSGAARAKCPRSRRLRATRPVARTRACRLGGATRPPASVGVRDPAPRGLVARAAPRERDLQPHEPAGLGGHPQLTSAPLGHLFERGRPVRASARRSRRL